VPPRPVIGIATQTQEAVAGKSTTCWIMGQRYVRALTASGAVPWLIPLLPDDEDMLRAVYEHLDGIFLTGGVDVDPSCYGEERHERCGRSDLARDRTEMALIRWALADHKPVLGVCRGIQVINVACGGSLYQHLPGPTPTRSVSEGPCVQAIKHDYFSPGTPYTRDYLAHEVRVDLTSRLGRLLGTGQVPVNSMHHQGIKQLAPTLRASAWAPDNLIEGVEMPNGQYLIGVQWHPEELVEDHAPMRRLFADFVAAASIYRQRSNRRGNDAPHVSPLV
jgi:putative glutamine amidotransferase